MKRKVGLYLQKNWQISLLEILPPEASPPQRSEGGGYGCERSELRNCLPGAVFRYPQKSGCNYRKSYRTL